MAVSEGEIVFPDLCTLLTADMIQVGGGLAWNGPRAREMAPEAQAAALTTTQKCSLGPNDTTIFTSCL